MSLQPPRDESLNGLLQGYRIYYRELEYEAASATEPKMLSTPSALRTELPGEPRLPRVLRSPPSTCSCMAGWRGGWTRLCDSPGRTVRWQRAENSRALGSPGWGTRGVFTEEEPFDGGHEHERVSQRVWRARD